MTIDIKKVLSEYDADEYDFGFSSLSEEEYKKDIAESEKTVESYKKRLLDVEKLILPFLMKLVKTSNNPHIYWPNRKNQIEKQIEKLVNLTRD